MPRPVRVPDRATPSRSTNQNKTRRQLGHAVGLTQFGVNLLELGPGAWSSQRHWHAHEVKFVFVLRGPVVLVTLLQPRPYLGQERCRRCRRPLRCLLLVILPAAMTAADLCMGGGHCAEEEQQRPRQPTPKKTRPCRVAWRFARLNVTHPYRPRSCAWCFAAEFSTANQPADRIRHSSLWHRRRR